MAKNTSTTTSRWGGETWSDDDPYELERAADEIQLYAESTGELYPMRQDIERAMLKAMQGGYYDRPHFVGHVSDWVEKATQLYKKEMDRNSRFTERAKERAARELTERWETEIMVSHGGVGGRSHNPIEDGHLRIDAEYNGERYTGHITKGRAENPGVVFPKRQLIEALVEWQDTTSACQHLVQDVGNIRTGFHFIPSNDRGKGWIAYVDIDGWPIFYPTPKDSSKRIERNRGLEALARETGTLISFFQAAQEEQEWAGGAKGRAENPTHPHRMFSGYAFEYNGEHWKTSKSDEWDTVMQSADEPVEYVGERSVDGSRVSVFRKLDGSGYYAQLAHMTRAHNPMGHMSPKTEKIVGGVLLAAAVAAGAYFLFRPKTANAATPPTSGAQALPGDGAPLFSPGDRIIVAGDTPTPQDAASFAAIVAALQAKAPDLQFIPQVVPLVSDPSKGDPPGGVLDQTPIANAVNNADAQGLLMLWSRDAANHPLVPEGISFGRIKLLEVAPEGATISAEEERFLRQNTTAESRLFALNPAVSRSDPAAFADAVLHAARNQSGIRRLSA